MSGIIVTAPLGWDNIELIEEAKKGARQYSELFHCTDADALLSIVRNREFWLSNLNIVNDKEEQNRITLDDYKDSCFVACFTYENDVDPSHWKEYGVEDRGILFSVSPTWFLKSATYINTAREKDKSWRIFSTREEVVQEIKQCIRVAGADAYCELMTDFAFYKIKYDDTLIADMQASATSTIGDAQLIAPQTIGIIKHTHGVCTRKGCKPYDKNWEIEKEVRLKVIVHPYCGSRRLAFPKIAVPLCDQAFSSFKIRFSPHFPLSERKNYLDKLQSLLPGSYIEIL